MGRAQPQPWEQLPNESWQAYEAFDAYCQMGADRSLEAVGQKLGKSRVLMERWSSTHRWMVRVRAWDGYVAEQARQRIVKRHADMIESQVKVLGQSLAVLVEALKQEPLLMARLADELMVWVSRGRGLDRYMQVMAMLRQNALALVQLIAAERLVHGLSTSNVAQQQVAEGGPFGGAAADFEYPDPEDAAAARAFIAQISRAAAGAGVPIE